MTAIGLSIRPGSPRGAPAVAVPTLDLNFLAGTLPSEVTFTRASTAWHFDAAGALVSVASNVPRFDYNPASLALRGLLIEPAATNSLRNSAGAGATAGVVGSGGAAPTNWSATVGVVGVTTEIVDTGTEAGIPYVDVRYHGTGTGAAQFQFESSTQIVATSGQAWAASVFVKLLAGTLDNVTVQINLREGSAAGAQIVSNSTTIVPTSSGLATQRFPRIVTATNASTERVHCRLFLNTAGAVDFTLRVGLPQLELGLAPTSPIITTGTAGTRAQETPTASTLTPWFNAASGAIVAEAMLSSTALATRTVAQLDDGTATTNRVFLHADSAGVYRGIISSGGANSVNTSLGSTADETVFKLGASWAENNFAVAKGDTTGTAVSGSVPASISQLRIGHRAGTQLTGWIQRIRVWPGAKTLAELSALTA